MWQRRVLTALALAALLGSSVQALDLGAAAPVFNANNQDGDLWLGSEHVGHGKYLVVYFYPAAMTGGCTQQACAYRDDAAALRKLGIEVVGVSADPVRNLKAFQEAEGINFPLLSDVNGTIARLFGVPLGKGGSIQRSVGGEERTLVRPYTTSRWTFIVGPQGKLIHRNEKVRAAQDSAGIRRIVAQHRAAG